jgi:hypothetical protein
MSIPIDFLTNFVATGPGSPASVNERLLEVPYHWLPVQLPGLLPGANLGGLCLIDELRSIRLANLTSD